MEEKKIIVTVEQDGKKAVINITPNKEGGMDVKANWQPALDKGHLQGKDVLTMQILELLRG